MATSCCTTPLPKPSPPAIEYFRNGTLCDHNTVPGLFGICGRALGIASNKSGYVYYCDVYKGLFGVGPSSGQDTQIVSFAGGHPVFFCNAVDVGDNGTIYFTDGSQKYRNNTMARANNDTSGRFLSYEPETGKVTELATGLSMPAGITVSSDNSYVLISQIIQNSISKFNKIGPFF